MKTKIKSIFAFVGCATHLAAADVYWNDKTFLESEMTDEVVHIGHADAADGGSADNALVTVKSGAVWTNTQGVILGEAAGTAKLTVEGGGAVELASLAVASAAGNTGSFELQENAKAVVSNVTVATGSGSKSGFVSLADESELKDVLSVKLGGGEGSVGRLELNGGKLEFDSTSNAPKDSMMVGSNYRAMHTDGIVSGYGTVRYSNANLIMNAYDRIGRTDTYSGSTLVPGWGHFRLHGQVIADGKGIERDLDFSQMGVPNTASTQNQCGTNGWYAINKGRLLMPRFPRRKGGNYQFIGGFPYREDVDLVNSFKYCFDDDTRKNTKGYIFAELHATDRDDIPAGLPSGTRYHPSSIWRIGHFNLDTAPNHNTLNKNLKKDYKAGFVSVNLKFHYDPRLTEMEDVDVIRVYRCAEKAKGAWTCIGETLPSSESPYVQTEDFGPGSDLYNFGWFAIVGEKKVGTVVVVR